MWNLRSAELLTHWLDFPDKSFPEKWCLYAKILFRETATHRKTDLNNIYTKFSIAIVSTEGDICSNDTFLWHLWFLQLIFKRISLWGGLISSCDNFEWFMAWPNLLGYTCMRKKCMIPKHITQWRNWPSMGIYWPQTGWWCYKVNNIIMVSYWGLNSPLLEIILSL